MKQFKNLIFQKEGSVIDSKTMKPLIVNQRGYFTFKGVKYNLAKCLLKYFKDIEVKSGRITHLDGDRRNFNVNNIEYTSKQKKALKPSEKDIFSLLETYFVMPDGFSLFDSFNFRLALSIITERQAFFEKYKNLEGIEVFKDYVQPALRVSIHSLAKKHKITVEDSKNIINLCLNKLVEDAKEISKYEVIKKWGLKLKKKRPTQNNLQDWENFRNKFNKD
jgi:hypothetical protein